MFRRSQDFLVHHGFFLALAAISLVLVPTAAAASEAPVPEAAAAAPLVQELWYRVEVGGVPAGFMVSREIDDGEHLVSESDLRLRFQRGGNAQKIALSSRFVETPEHQPTSLWSRQELGPQPVETSYRFDAGGVVVTTAAGEQRRPRPEGEWLTPFAAQARLEAEIEKLLAGGAPGGGVGSFEIRTLDPSLGLQPVSTRWVLEAADTSLEIDGRSRPASHWRQSQSFAPQVTSDVYLSPDGLVLRSVTPILGLEMAVILSSKEKVTNLGEGPELLVQSFIFPDRRIENPRSLRRAAYRLTTGDGTPVVPTVGAQRQHGDRIVVDLGRPITPDERPRRGQYLVSSTYLRHQDPGLRALHAEAVSSAGEDPSLRAETLRLFVSRHLRHKNLDSILATAVEAAASRSGDCTEHAVLLAALLRADGIPARVVTGIIYVDSFAGKRHLFAYHMWTQAWLADRWHDLDATLGATAFDAAHIILDTPDLDDEGAALMHMAAIAPLIGGASIQVLETHSELSHSLKEDP